MIFNNRHGKCKNKECDKPCRFLEEGAKTLDLLKPGDKAKILAVRGKGALRRHLLDMGLTPNTAVMVRKMAPLGDPIELYLRSFELTIRKDDARHIIVEEISG